MTDDGRKRASGCERLKVALYDLDMNDIVATWSLDPSLIKWPVMCTFHCPDCKRKCEAYREECGRFG
jgi:hypothetical protein